MSCPTCDHTLAVLVVNHPLRYSLCQRCGTVVVEDLQKREADWDVGQRNVYVPKLVERCREFGKRFFEPVCDPAQDRADWHTLGIAESINRPEDRPK